MAFLVAGRNNHTAHLRNDVKEHDSEARCVGERERERARRERERE